MMGLSSAVYGPAISGLVGGSNYNILGPAGALVNILMKFSSEYGPEIIPRLAFVSGLIIMGVFLLKLEKYCTVIPLSVLEGFSFGVAITIGCGQLNNALGLKGLKKHPEFYMNVMETVENAGELQGHEFTAFLIFFVVLFSLMKFLPGKPWIVPVALLGILYGFICDKAIPSIRPTLLMDMYPKMLEGAVLIDFSYLKKDIPLSVVLVGSLEVAFVAVLETLISARIADNRTWTRFDQKKEVFGLSLANIVAGFFGGTPCTGVLVRTAVNISSGATDKISQFINAIVVLVVVLLLLPVFTYVPMPVIASILLTSAFRLMPLKVMWHLIAIDISEFIILLFTTFVCVFVDGAIGLIAGSFICLLRNAVKSSKTQYKHEVEVDLNSTQLLVISFFDNLTFINAGEIEVAMLDLIKKTKPDFVVFDCSEVENIDADGLEALQNLFKFQKYYTMALVLQKTSTNVIENSGWFKKAADDTFFFANGTEARNHVYKKGITLPEDADANQVTGGEGDDDYKQA